MLVSVRMEKLKEGKARERDEEGSNGKKKQTS